jgi:NADPH-dependent curcumin reductase
MMNKQVLLRKRPVGMVQDDDFEMVESAMPTIEDGQVLIANEFVSLDPAMRGWMNEGTTYVQGVALGAVMRAFAVGKIVESKHADFQIGDAVQGLTGAQTFAVSDGKNLSKCDLSKGPLSWHLGILGMPGMTAYFGLLERGRPTIGDTIFISGAAGVVGSTVGQIAKILGCNVIGSANGEAKCDYLKSIGFDATIDYKKEDTQKMLAVHAPNKLNIFYDNVGGEILDAALINLAWGARVVICGAISQYNNTSWQGPKNYMKLVSARASMTGIIVFDFLERYPEAVTQLSEWMHNGQLQYKEHVVEGIDQFSAALRMLFTGENFGKLVLKLN